MFRDFNDKNVSRPRPQPVIIRFGALCKLQGIEAYPWIALINIGYHACYQEPDILDTVSSDDSDIIIIHIKHVKCPGANVTWNCNNHTQQIAYMYGCK